MTEYLFRRNTVLEALRGNRRKAHRLWVQTGSRDLDRILAAARLHDIPVEYADKGRLSRLAGESSHQGVLLEAGPYPYSSVEEIIALAGKRGEQPFLLILDLLHGPQNIGSLMRVAEACGVHGVILQDRRAPEITPRVAMYSAGATEHLLIAQVTNLVQTMQRLKSSGVWMVGLDLTVDALLFGQVDLNMAIGVVIGHEGHGLRRLVRETCDFLIQLPMRGKVESLNAATAGAILLYSAWQARGFHGAPP